MNSIDNKLLTIIYNEIKLNPKVTEIYLAQKYNYSERTIRRYIKILRDSKKVAMVGFGKKKRWKIL